MIASQKPLGARPCVKRRKRAVCRPTTHTMAAEIVAQLRGTAAEREAAYARLLQLEAEHFNANGGSSGSVAEIAVACASPLCEVLCKPVSEVEVSEWHRASQVLAALTGVDPARVAGECNKPGQANVCTAFLAPDSVLGVVLAKDPSSLTIEDALTVASAMAAWAVGQSIAAGTDASLAAAGISMMEFMGMAMPSFFLMVPRTPSDDRNLFLFPLLLELLKAPEKLPDFVLCGVLGALQNGLIGRPAVAAKLLEHDAVAIIMNILQQVRTLEYIYTRDMQHEWTAFSPEHPNLPRLLGGND